MESVECGMWSEKCRVWSGKCGVGSVEWGVGSGKWEVGSVERGVWSVECHSTPAPFNEEWGVGVWSTEKRERKTFLKRF